MVINATGGETGIVDAVIKPQRSPILDGGTLTRQQPQNDTFLDKVVADQLREEGIGGAINVRI